MKTIGKLKQGSDHWNYGVQFGKDHRDEFVIAIFFFKFVNEGDKYAFSNEMAIGFNLTFKVKLG